MPEFVDCAQVLPYRDKCLNTIIPFYVKAIHVPARDICKILLLQYNIRHGLQYNCI